MPNAFEIFRDSYYDQMGVEKPEDETEIAQKYVETVGPQFAQEFMRGMGRGVGGILEGLGAAMRILGGEDWGKATVELGQEIIEAFPQHPSLVGNLVDSPELLSNPAWWAGGLGSLAPMLAGQGAVLGGMRAAGAGLRAAAGTGGVVAGMTEGLPLYNELVDEQDMGRLEAAGRAGLNAAGVTALNALPLARALTPGRGQVVGTMLAEAATEFAEEPLEALLDPEGDIIESLKAGATVAPLAAVTGGALGGVTNLAQQPAPTQQQMVEAMTAGGPAAGLSIKPIDEPGGVPDQPSAERATDAPPVYTPSPLERALENDLDTGWNITEDKAEYTPLSQVEKIDLPEASGRITLAEALGEDSQLAKDYPQIAATPIVPMTQENIVENKGYKRVGNEIQLDRTKGLDEQKTALRGAINEMVAEEEDFVAPQEPKEKFLDQVAQRHRERIENQPPVREEEKPILTVNDLANVPLQQIKNIGGVKRKAFTETVGQPADYKPVDTKTTEQNVSDNIAGAAVVEGSRDTVHASEAPSTTPAPQHSRSSAFARDTIAQIEDPAKNVPSPRVLQRKPHGVTQTPRGPVIGSTAVKLADPAYKEHGVWSDHSQVVAKVHALNQEIDSRKAEGPTTISESAMKALSEVITELGMKDAYEAFMSSPRLKSISEETLWKSMVLWNAAKNNYLSAIRAFEADPHNAELEQKLGWAKADFEIAQMHWDDIGRIAGRVLRFRQASNLFSAGEKEAILSTKGNAAALSHVTRKFRKATKFDVFLEVWMAGLLSNPVTWTVNTLSNALVMWSMDAEMLLLAGVAKVKGDKAAYEEAVNYLGHGVLKHGLDAVQRGLNSFSTEEEYFDMGKVDARRFQAISSEALGKDPASKAGALIDKVGRGVRTPFRVLMGTDAFFKHLLYEKELYRLGVKKFRSKNQRLNERDYRIRLQKFLKNEIHDAKLHPDLHRKARQHALYGTFNKDNGPFGQSLARMANAHPSLRLILPFIRTPLNIISFTAERTPAAFLMKTQVRPDLLGRNGKEAQRRAWARLSLGTAIMGSMVMLAAAGMITGGAPRDPEERRKWYVNNQPYSIRIGDSWFSYGRLEPLGILVGLAADFVHLYDYMEANEAGEFAQVVVGGLAYNFMSKTWLTGIARLVEVITEPERYGDTYISRLLASIVPAGVAQVERINDPYLRYSQGVIEHIRDRVPWANTDLPMRYDIFGQPIKLSPDYVPSLLNLINPVYVKQYKDDKVAQELIRLKVNVRHVAKKIGTYELTSEERMEWQKISGRLVHQYMSSIVNSAAWDTASAFQQQEMLEEARREAQSLAREIFIYQNPSILLNVELSGLESDFVEGPTRLNF